MMTFIAETISIAREVIRPRVEMWLGDYEHEDNTSTRNRLWPELVRDWPIVPVSLWVGGKWHCIRISFATAPVAAILEHVRRLKAEIANDIPPTVELSDQ